MTVEFSKPDSHACGQVYISGHIIDFSPANNADFLSCPHYTEIEGSGLEGDANFDKVASVLTREEEATWPYLNRLNSNQILPSYMILFRVCCGDCLPTTKVTVVLKERADLLYAFATKKKSTSALLF